MKNLNERRREAEIEGTDIPGRTDNPSEAEVVPFSRPQRSSTQSSTQKTIMGDEVDQLRTRWTAIQTNFVDEPRKAIEDADVLVSAAIKRISDAFQEERRNLEQHWKSGKDVSTEDLRQSLQNYRAMFSRLLSI
jgi:hypothetical protein